jgi:hypothetical protein
MAETAPRRRRLHMMVDQERYSQNTERRQKRLQGDMLSLLEEAADLAGLDHASWDKQEAGDGLLAVMQEDVDDAKVLSDFLTHLNALLGEDNAPLRREFRLRLRVALVHGISIDGPNGKPGQAPISAGRLIDAPVVKAALADSEEANMVVVIDDRLFEDVVRQRLRGLRPEAWVRVRVKVKTFDAPAYISVPGHHPAAEPTWDPRATSSGEADTDRAVRTAPNVIAVDHSTAVGRDYFRDVRPQSPPPSR